MTTKQLVLSVISFVVLLVATNSFFVVNETERVLVLRFDKVLRSSEGEAIIFGPGIHFKFVIADKIRRFDSRIQTMDAEPDRVFSSEKKDLIVDTYVKWRIKDFSKFYQATNGNVERLQLLLAPQLEAILKAQIGQRTVGETLSDDRSALMNALRDVANEKAPSYGIEVIDVRMKKVNYPSSVYPNVFQRMRAERARVATEFRSEGQEEATFIRAKTDAEVKRIIAEADQVAREIRGNADAEAAEIYAKTYNKNPEFYAFLRSLDAYKKTFGTKNDVLVIEPDSDFFKYLKDQGKSKN